MRRRCPCGTILASDNSGLLCGRCQRAVRDGERGAGHALIVRKARAAVDAYAIPERAFDGETYLQNLSTALDELCLAFHVTLPQFEGTRFDPSYRKPDDVQERRSA